MAQTSETPILKTAWQLAATWQAAAADCVRGQLRLRLGIAIAAILATALALLSQLFPTAILLKIVLLLTLLTGPALAIYLHKFYADQDGLTLRAAAAGVQRAIYIYRTRLSQHPKRDDWLAARLAEIQRQAAAHHGGETLVKEAGAAPTAGDPDLADLSAEAYFVERLQHELADLRQKLAADERKRRQLQAGSLLVIASGILLAALGGTLAMWAALSVVVAGTLSGWNALHDLDARRRRQRVLIVELSLLCDHWLQLGAAERDQAQFFQMVQATEALLWNQYREELPGELALPDLATGSFSGPRLAESRPQTETTQREAAPPSTEPVFSEAFPPKAPGGIPQELGYILAASGAMTSALQRQLRQVAAESEPVDFNKETPKEILHDRMSQYPASGEIKG